MGRIKWITKEDGEREPTYVSDWHDKETKQYPQEHDKKISDADAEFIVKKIARHFKLGNYSIRFHGHLDSGRIWYGGLNKEVCLSHNPSFALITHELTHPLCHKRYKKQIAHGCRKWQYQLSRIVDYCKKKNFWEQDLKDRGQRRIETSKPKPQPTAIEIRDEKITKAETKIKRYESKMKRYQNKLQKAKRSLNILKKNQEKECIKEMNRIGKEIAG
jgi:hypothetical protein